jgi:hypothetical protein
MSKVPQTIPLPEAVIRHLIERHGEAKVPAIVKGALQNVLTSKPEHRIAMMQAALPVINSSRMYSFPCRLPDDVFQKVVEYCWTMKLSFEPLFVGSMLFLLEMASPPNDLPSFDEVCGT